jgi:rhamnose transport system ATP-binding protein
VSPVVELRDVKKAFGGVHALRGVDLVLEPGEVHSLVGENGAGKSTLVRIMGGIHQPDEGTILVGRQPRDRYRRIDWKAMYREVGELLGTLGVKLDPRTPVQGLSVADQQLVEIAKSLSLNARVVVMDEPTAALSSREVERLFGIVRDLRDRGVAVVYISHRLEEVFALSDTITVLRDGAHVVTNPAKEMDTVGLIRHMVGRELDDLFPKEESEIGAPILEVRGLTREGVFHDVGFELRRGEILGFAGLVGAGRSEVVRALFGIDPLDAGEVFLDGAAVRIRSASEAVAAGLAFVPEDRQHQGLVLEMAIADNATLPFLRRLTNRIGLLDRKRERAVATEYTQRLQVKAGGLDLPVGTLSGGNQQKVVLAKWLATDPKVLILDEPTRGIDIGTKAEVHRIVSRLAAQGLAIVLISSELPEVLAMSDRVLVMHEGRVTGVYDRDQADQETIMHAATGQEATNVG